MARARIDGRVICLCGGVGGAKLALGLARVLTPDRLTIVVNTGDDFEHLGLAISPDLDTVLYTLAGVANPETGWGRADETWTFLERLAAAGGQTWFRIGDKDLTLHVHRQALLDEGRTLSEVSADLAGRFGVPHAIVPMTDDPVRTVVETPAGRLAFQDYFVRRKCTPALTGLRFEGIERAVPSPAFAAALAAPDLAGVVICPSNPFVSIGPILALPGVRERLKSLDAPVVAVSPIVAGAALKGPTAKMMAELGYAVSPLGIADFYGDLLDVLVIDTADTPETTALQARGLGVQACNTVMTTLEDRMELARGCLTFLSPHPPAGRGH